MQHKAFVKPFPHILWQATGKLPFFKAAVPLHKCLCLLLVFPLGNRACCIYQHTAGLYIIRTGIQKLFLYTCYLVYYCICLRITCVRLARDAQTGAGRVYQYRVVFAVKLGVPHCAVHDLHICRYAETLKGSFHQLRPVRVQLP